MVPFDGSYSKCPFGHYFGVLLQKGTGTLICIQMIKTQSAHWEMKIYSGVSYVFLRVYKSVVHLPKGQLVLYLSTT